MKNASAASLPAAVPGAGAGTDGGVDEFRRVGVQ
jgi:hypothetical protein